CNKVAFENAKDYFKKWGANYFDLIAHKNRYEERDVGVGINISPWSKIVGSRYLSANVTASVIDTLVSKVAKAVPSVQYVTSGGSWTEQKQAENLEKYVTGTFLNRNFQGNARRMFGDACKVGTGFIVLDDHNGSLCYHNYPAYQVMCDWIDAQSGQPVDIHFVDLISRFRLMQLYPEHKEKLLITNSASYFYTDTNLNSKDCVVVIRSYNTFARRRAITVENCTLRDDDTLMGENGLTNSSGEPIPPYVYMNYKDTSLGMFSIGIAEELRPLHDSVDKTLRIIQRSAHLCSVPKVWVSRQANIVETLIDNDIGTIGLYDGPPSNVPVSQPMGIIPTDLYHLVQYYYDLAFKKAGMSQLTANSQKPPGLNSGKALDTYFDIEADRFQSTAKKYERAIIGANYLTVKYSRYLQKMGYKQKSKFYGRDIQKVLDFDKVDLDEEYFDIQAYPTSIIPQTPSGRYQTIRDMMQAGLVDANRALKLLDMPDIEDDIHIQNAQNEYVRYQISCIVDNNETISVNSAQDLDMLINEAQNHYFYYKQKNMDPDALDRLEKFIQDAILSRDQRGKDATAIAQMIMEQQQQEAGAAGMQPRIMAQ